MLKQLNNFLIVVFFAALMPEAIYAAESGISLSESTVDLSAFLKMFVGSIGVVALIFVVAWLSRKMKFVQNLTNGYQITNLATLSLTTREKVCLLEVGGKHVLVGIAPGTVNQLHVFDEKIEIKDAADLVDPKKGFSTHFKKALGISSAEGEHR